MVARWKAEAAVATLENLGYTYSGGTLWKPPLGKPPAYLGIETGGCAPPVLATPPPGGQPRSVDGSQPKEASPMRTVKSSVNTTTHTLDPVDVQNALASHTRAGSFGPLADPNLDTIDVTLLSNGGAEIVVVNTPPATEENR